MKTTFILANVTLLSYLYCCSLIIEQPHYSLDDIPYVQQNNNYFEYVDASLSGPDLGITTTKMLNATRNRQ